MTVAAGEMQMGVGRDTLLRYLKGESTPQQPALGAMARWARLHAAPPAQTQAAGLKPSDYMLNLRVHAGQQLCGVTLARLKDFVTLLGLGELNDNASQRVRDGLTCVLKRMDEQDTQWAVEMSLLCGDQSVVRSATSPLPSPHTQPSPPAHPPVRTRATLRHAPTRPAAPDGCARRAPLPSLQSLPSLQTCAVASSLYPRRMTATIPRTATPATAWATTPPSYWDW